MINPKKFYIPYKSEDWAVRVLLFEKIKPKLGGISFCCWINDVTVYCDLSTEKDKAILGYKLDSTLGLSKKQKNFIIVGYELEQVKTDSSILQKLANIIENYDEKTDLDSRD